MFQRFICTFSQESPFKDGWIDIFANDVEEVRKYMKDYPHWCGVYDFDYFHDEGNSKFFSRGCIGVKTIA